MTGKAPAPAPTHGHAHTHGHGHAHGPAPAPLAEYVLSAREADELRETLARLCPDTDNAVDPAFYDKHWRCHTRLPQGLHRFLENFRRTEPAHAALIHGFPVDDGAVGPTPAHWDRPVSPASATAESDRYMALCALALGEPFAWATLQHGRMIQDVFPIRGDEKRLNGHGSDIFLVFHTDDAFHPLTCDYLLLFGVRNHDRVPTRVASARDLCLDPEHRRLLSEARFHIEPDEEHIRQLAARMPGHPALQRAIRMRDKPQAVPVLYGAADHPYLRYDREYLHCVEGGAQGDGAGLGVGAGAGVDGDLREARNLGEARDVRGLREVPDARDLREALDALDAELERVSSPVVVGQGTLLILDNKVAAHARDAFTARYDGTDRWLRKIIVLRDLRKWSGTMADPGGRLVL